MTTNEVESICVLIDNTLGLARGTVQPGGDLLDDYGADSLDIVELMMFIE